MKERLMNYVVVWLLALFVPAAAAQDWQPARAGYRYAFPRDHGQHPDHKIEWWYYTGNVRTAAGRRFGYQLTFFRLGAVPRPAVDSKWALRDVWMAHFAVTDVQGQRYHHADRLNRAGPGLAGADAGRVWNEDWSMVIQPGGAMHLSAADRSIAVDLRLTPGKPAVIHGRDGVSEKGATPGNATHYYSLTRMPTAGSIKIDGEVFAVTGESWMDHEFGTSFLEPETQGWDWFSAQLDDGSELMLFQLRQAAAAKDRSPPTPRYNAGTLVRPDGSTVALAAADFQLRPADAWTSPTGAAYPQVWTIEVPAHGVQLVCRSAMRDQEFRARSTPGLSYWEGAVDYTGTINGRPVKGQGYLEMTGYSGRAMSVWFGE